MKPVMFTLLIALAAAISLAQTGTRPDQPTQLPSSSPGRVAVPVPVGGGVYGGWPAWLA
jgi:hypothetical protein